MQLSGRFRESLWQSEKFDDISSCIYNDVHGAGGGGLEKDPTEGM